MRKVKTVHYYHAGLSSFVEKDIAILQAHFDLKIHFFSIGKSKTHLPFSFIRQFFTLLFARKRSAVVVTQFGGFHTILPSFFSRISRLKSVIVLGGADCVSFPSIDYGNFSRKLLGLATGFSLKHADLLLPVHETLIRYRYTYQDQDGEYQGYLAHKPDITTAAQVILNGYDSVAWTIGSAARERHSYVTIGVLLGSRFGSYLKGIDLIIEAARSHPDCRFYIVGGKGLPVGDQPGNLILLDKIPNNELNAFLQTKQFYLQLSMSEGFPNALCESMLSGCIPIVSAVGAMPDIVADQGFVLQRKSSDLLSKLLKETQQLSEEELNRRSQLSRDRIVHNYPLKLREEQLVAAIQGL